MPRNELMRLPSDHFPAEGILTSEFQSAKLKGDQTVPNFNQVNKGIEVIRSQDKAVPRAVVPPATKN